MTIHTFISDKDFEQAALNLVARMVFDNAAEYISGGNVADIGEQTFEYLEQVATAHDLSPSAINTYHDMIADENQAIKDLHDDHYF